MARNSLKRAKNRKITDLLGAKQPVAKTLKTVRFQDQSAGQAWVSTLREPYGAQETTHGTVEQRWVYAGLAGRFWYGAPGESDLVAASALIFEPVLKTDQQTLLEQMKLSLRRQLAQGIQQKTGLAMQADGATLDRAEWLDLWEADGSLLRRLRMFEDGYRPQIITDVTKLTSRDIKQIVQNWRGSGAIPKRDPEGAQHSLLLPGQ